MQTQIPGSRNIALGLLGISFAALLLGLYNAVLTPLTHPDDANTKDSSGQGFSAAFGPTKVIHRDTLLLIELTGPIMMEANTDSIFSSESNAMSARKALDKAAKEDSIKGVLLKIDSPGGTVGMSQELNGAVQRVSKKKPIVVYMGDVAASGGYYTACAADKIVANPGTLTASIGVIMSTLNVKGFLTDKLGVKAFTFKSGKFKDILSPYREPTTEDKALLQDLINTSYRQFLNAVLAGRTRFVTDPKQKADLIKKITAIADGRVVVGEKAKQVGLVDELGDQDAAYTLLDNLVKERFHIKDRDKRLPLEEFDNEESLLSLLGLTSSSVTSLIQGVRSDNPSRQALQSLTGGRLPLTLQFPNQPLWVLE